VSQENYRVIRPSGRPALALRQGLRQFGCMNRRDFVRIDERRGRRLGRLPGAKLVSISFSSQARPDRRSQLYTVRQAMRQDFDGSPRARCRPSATRTWSSPGTSTARPDQVKAALDAHGLKAPSTHLEPVALEKKLGADHRREPPRWGMSTSRWPGSTNHAARPWTTGHRIADSVQSLGRRRKKKAGMGFAYHNHNYEFAPVEGQIPYDLLLASTDPSTVVPGDRSLLDRLQGHRPVHLYQPLSGTRTHGARPRDMDAAGKMLGRGRGKRWTSRRSWRRGARPDCSTSFVGARRGPPTPSSRSRTATSI